MLEFKDFQGSRIKLEECLLKMREEVLLTPSIIEKIKLVEQLNKGKNKLSITEKLKILTISRTFLTDEKSIKKLEATMGELFQGDINLEDTQIDFTKFSSNGVKNLQVDIENLFIYEFKKLGGNLYLMHEFRANLRKTSLIEDVFSKAPISAIAEEKLMEVSIPLMN